MITLQNRGLAWWGVVATGVVVVGGMAEAAEEALVPAPAQSGGQDFALADSAVEGFLRAEAEEGPRYAAETGRKVVERNFSGKDLCLFQLFITKGGTARMWPHFAEMTADDQEIYAEAVASSVRAGEMADLQALLAAAPLAKSEAVRETVRRSLNSLVFFLLDAPDAATADQAAEIGQGLRKDGKADALLVAKLQRRAAGTERERSEGDRAVDAFLVAPSTSAMLGRISWMSRAADSRKSWCAHRLADLHDVAAYARMWRLLPGLSADDQVIFSEPVLDPVDVEQALPMARAALAQPVENARERMLGAASTLVVRALEDPERKARALEIAAQMKADGTAQDFLLEKMK